MSGTGKAAIGIVAGMFVLSLCSPLFPGLDPYRIDLDAVRMAPGFDHLFGTDSKGRDILARVFHAGRLSLGTAFGASMLSAIVGFIIGIISGYHGGKTDLVLMGITDFFLSFPSLLLAIAITIILPQGTFTVAIALTAAGWTSFARLVRGHVLAVREMPFIEGARAMGCGHGRIVFRHIAPLCIPLVLVTAGIKLSGFLLSEATLGFLGLGVQPPVPTWGSMISAGRAYILSAPWIVLIPGAILSLNALCLNIAGEELKKRYGGREG